MTKEEGLDRRGGYYQTIAKVFVGLRGAPFFLSSKELDRVRKWEEARIPLRIVLEGIRGSFEQPRRLQGKRHRPYTLDHCNSFVLRAFDLYRERSVGRKTKTASGVEKSWDTEILREIERFLVDLPEELQTLKPVYQKLQGKLSRGEATEEELEKTEEVIEELIEESLSAEQTKTITAEIRAEFGKISGAEFDKIFRLKALKATRRKHRIPHVSPFYY